MTKTMNMKMRMIDALWGAWWFIRWHVVNPCIASLVPLCQSWWGWSSWQCQCRRQAYSGIHTLDLPNKIKLLLCDYLISLFIIWMRVFICCSLECLLICRNNFFISQLIQLSSACFARFADAWEISIAVHSCPPSHNIEKVPSFVLNVCRNKVWPVLPMFW